MTEKIIRQDVDGLCTLTFNRPDKLNALDRETFETLDAHLADLEQQTESVGCVVLTGAGRAFSAGNDLGTLGKDPEPPTFRPKIIDRLANLPQPTVAAVRGVCFTGALEVALACDFILADATVRFGDTHGKFGLVPTWGMAMRLPRRVGQATAMRITMTGAEVHAEEAKAIGLADLTAPDGGLDDLVAEYTGQILRNSWHCNRHMKRIIRETDGLPIGQAIADTHYRHPGHAPDWRDRVASFSRRK